VRKHNFDGSAKGWKGEVRSRANQPSTSGRWGKTSIMRQDCARKKKRTLLFSHKGKGNLLPKRKDRGGEKHAEWEEVEREELRTDGSSLVK